MLIDDYINQGVSEFEKTIEFLKNEFAKLQVGRASPGMVESVMVEAYGQKQAMKAVASVTVPDPKTLVIKPWDRSNLSAIEKAIQTSNLGFNPVNDGIVIRINVPALTEERRQDLTKVVSKLAEEAKVSIRHYRQEVMTKLKDSEKAKDISEDELHGGEKKLQLKVDDYNLKIDEMMKTKEKDIMTI